MVFAASLPVAALAATGGAPASDPMSSDQSRTALSSDQSRAQSGTPMSSDQQRASTSARFDALDTNHDGVISRSEFGVHEANGASAVPASSTNGASAAPASSNYMRATTLMGSDVRDTNGKDIGKVQDLLVDVDTGKVKSAIVSLGNDSRTGTELYRYPITAFSRSGTSNELLLKTSERPPEPSQKFGRDNWPSWVAGSDKTASSSQRQSGVWQASRLIGKDIEDRNGEHLGEIADLVIDSNTGDVAQAIMRYDRPWSLDNPLVAVPLESLDFHGGRRAVSMDVDRNNFDSLPAFSSAAPNGVFVERWIVLVPKAITGNGTRNAATSSPSVATGSAPGNAAGSVSGNTYSMSGDAMTSSSGATGSNANSTRQ
jgi:sporulation protein YlmC with PRC-barrel domain